MPQMASFSYKNGSAGSSENQRPFRCKNYSTQKNQEKLQLRKFFVFAWFKFIYCKGKFKTIEDKKYVGLQTQ